MNECIDQTQKGGTESTNVQAGQVVIHQGLTFKDVKEIALDVFKANFETLSDVARQTARARAEEITEEFLKKLEQSNKNGLQKAETPEFQMSLLTVQREYVRSGDRKLGELLVDLLIDITKQENRNVLQIVLNECLTVAPKLTTDQVAALAIIFFFRYTRLRAIIPFGELARLIGAVVPFGALASKKNTCYQHLEFAGCGSVGVLSVSLGNAILSAHGGIFTKGFSREELTAAVPEITDAALLMQSLNEPDKLQFSAANLESLDQALQNKGASQEVVAKANAFWQARLYKPEEVHTKIIELVPEMDCIFDVWDHSAMKNFTLTSVGIAIAHAAIRSRTGVDLDLSIWIN